MAKESNPLSDLVGKAYIYSNVIRSRFYRGRSGGCSAFYFCRWDTSTNAFTQRKAPILPIVDSNSDGKVDAADMALLMAHWGKSNGRWDIGPFPWGDGFVDAQDLIVLAEYMASHPADANDVNAP